MNTLRIGPFDFYFSFVKDLKDDEGKESLLGKINVDRLFLQIDRDQHCDRAIAVLFHEAIHGFLDLNSIKRHDEAWIFAVAYGMTSFLRDNYPGAYEMIIQGLADVQAEVIDEPAPSSRF